MLCKFDATPGMRLCIILWTGLYSTSSQKCSKSKIVMSLTFCLWKASCKLQRWNRPSVWFFFLAVCVCIPSPTSLDLVGTIFPRNVTLVRFYFKALFGVATIQWWLDFKGGVYRDRHAHAHTALISLFVHVYAYNVRAHKCNSPQLFTVWRDFIGNIYWVSRQKRVAIFRGWWNVKVWRGFNKIQ